MCRDLMRLHAIPHCGHEQTVIGSDRDARAIAAAQHNLTRAQAFLRVPTEFHVGDVARVSASVEPGMIITHVPYGASTGFDEHTFRIYQKFCGVLRQRAQTDRLVWPGSCVANGSSTSMVYTPPLQSVCGEHILNVFDLSFPTPIRNHVTPMGYMIVRRLIDSCVCVLV